MAEIVVNLDKVSVSLAGRPIFTELGWELQDRQRIGLVGPNGAGKSTLLKLIAQELPADSGNVFWQTGLSWGRLEQEPDLPIGKTVLAEVLTAVPELALVEDAMVRLETKMGEPDVYGSPDALEKVMRQHERLLVQYEQMDGPRYQSQVKEALSRLGLGPAQWDTLTDHLSGGQKKLVMLAKLLVQQPRLLLLDEPDNHLDIPAKRHLEQLIHHYEGCVVIISHDRYLLDEVATQIAELENGRLTLYQGSYTAYVNERELRRLRQQQLYVRSKKK